MYQGQLDDINRQLERPMMPVRTKEELLKKQQELNKYNGRNRLKSKL